VKGISNGSLSKVSWSKDGDTLYAAGPFDVGGRDPVVAWAARGAGKRRFLFSGAGNSISSLKGLPNGGLLVAAADPHLAILNADGSLQWATPSPNFDPRGQRSNLSVSGDGTVVEFGYEFGGKVRVRFDLAKLKLMADPPTDSLTAPPRQTGLDIQGWASTTRPTLAGKPLFLDQYEHSLSLAIHPKGDRFVLGADWSLRAFDAGGKLLWRRDVPSVVWAVNITGDGRMVVAAYGDGTIRWHRMDDGRELLAFYPLIDKSNWVAWQEPMACSRGT
jgi:WD40 repeat protein